MPTKLILPNIAAKQSNRTNKALMVVERLTILSHLVIDYDIAII